MPLRHTVDHEIRRVFVHATPPFTLAEGLTFLDTQAEEGTWSYTSLKDFRSIGWRPTVCELQQYADRLDILTSEYGPRGAAAVVVTGRGVLYGMLRMLNMPREATMGVFNTIEEATTWLNEVPLKLDHVAVKSTV